jgi:serine/threonine protein kinase
MGNGLSDRNLIFGILALHADCITADQLVAGMNAWAVHKQRSLGEVLCNQGVLSERDCALLEQLVDRRIERHEGDTQASLIALRLTDSTLRTLTRVADPALRSAIVRHADRTALLESTVSEDPATLDFAAVARSQAGARFHVLRSHARGGIGEVFVARDEELGRTVALKEIQHRHATNPSLRSRFVIEAEITGNLEHRSIVPIYGLGTYADGRPFYAMRFVEGETLRDAIAKYHAESPSLPGRTRRLRLRELLSRFTDVCDAISYAHSRGILHRDLKPSNVMLGKYGETLIIDWGLAKAMGKAEPGTAEDPAARLLVPRSGDSHEPTVAGSAIGTPGYMSPEQARGDLEKINKTTDVYGLGGILYGILTSEAPVSGGSISDVIARVRAGLIEPPRKQRPELPRALEAITLKALSLRPEDRYRSARALAEEIEAYCADEPVNSYREPPHERAGRWLRKHQTLATTAAAVLLVGATAFGFAYAREAGYSRRLDRLNTRLAEARAESEDRLDLALEAIEDHYVGLSNESLLREPGFHEHRDRLLTSSQRFYERLAREAAHSPDIDARDRFLMARGRSELGTILTMVGRDTDARAECLAARDILEQLLGEKPTDHAVLEELASCENQLGLLADQGGDTAKALAWTSSAMTHGEAAALSLDRSDVRLMMVDATTRMGRILKSQGRLAAACAMFARGAENASRCLGLDPESAEAPTGFSEVQSELSDCLEQAARTGTNLADSLSSIDETTRRLRAAGEFLDRAIAVDPSAASLHRSRSALSRLQIEIDLAAARYEGAFTHVRRLLQRGLGEATDLYRAASTLAEGIPRAPESSREALAIAAIDCLRAAIEVGFRDASGLAHDPSFEPLRRDSRMREVESSLNDRLDREFPVDPFVKNGR